MTGINVIRRLVLLFVIAICWTEMAAQLPEVLTTEELGLQKVFIEANREKLLGEDEKAAELYRFVLEKDPLNDAAAYELSRVYLRMERYDDALDQINDAIRVESTNPWYLMMKADILERLEDYAMAIDVYEKLTASNTQENYYFFHLAELYERTNQPEKALAVLDRLEEYAGLLPQIVDYKVRILDSLGRIDQVIAEYERLSELYPYSTEYLQLAATYSEKAGDEARAEKLYRRILEIDPEDSRANLALAETNKSAGDDASYLSAIKPVMENPAIDLDAKVTEIIPYIEKFAAEPDPSYAKQLGELVETLARTYPSEAKAHALYADFLYHNGELSKAAQEYEKTLVLDKSVFSVWEQLLYLYAEMDQMDALIKTSENALNVFPNQASVFYLRGLAYAYKNDYNQSLYELQQALIMSGRQPELKFDVLSLMGKVYIPKGEASKAIEAFDKALELEPSDSELLLFYSGYLAESATDLNRAKQLAMKAYNQQPGNPEPAHVMALIEYQLEDFTEARKYIEEAMDNGAGDSYVSLELYGDILYQQDEIDKAVEYWTLSQEAGNTSPALKRKITERKIVH